MAFQKKTVNQGTPMAQGPQPSLAPSAKKAPWAAFGHSTPRSPGRGPARAVGTFVPKLTRTAFEKFGFSTAALLTDWPTIVGPKLASSTVPDRIKWPRSVEQDAMDGTSGPRRGATLSLFVDPARALDVQYQSALIIDRINAYFGYRAVAQLRIQQMPIAQAREPERPPVQTAPPRPADPGLAHIPDEGLRAALGRLEASVLARNL
jgi:hypothetical protein